jgi:intracellular sulfur oxidation DsrE/DsrF family protein
MTDPRVVFQLADGMVEDHQTALRNVRNAVADLPGASVCLVAHGPGIGLVTGRTGFADGIDELVEDGVEVLACRNTMARLGIPDDELRPGVGTVSAGIGEIVRRQQEGWAYVRI